MDPEGDPYRPDPAPGLGYADFRAARARYLAQLAAGSEVARLERAFALCSDDRAGGNGPAAGPTGPGTSATAASSATS